MGSQFENERKRDRIVDHALDNNESVKWKV